MNNQERIVISAYTGILMCKFSDMHEYIEKKLDRPVFTHELANKQIWDEIKEKVKPDFIGLCEGSV